MLTHSIAPFDRALVSTWKAIKGIALGDIVARSSLCFSSAYSVKAEIEGLTYAQQFSLLLICAHGGA